jgi:hypothetical protein
MSLTEVGLAASVFDNPAAAETSAVYALFGYALWRWRFGLALVVAALRARIANERARRARASKMPPGVCMFGGRV